MEKSKCLKQLLEGCPEYWLLINQKNTKTDIVLLNESLNDLFH